MDRVIIRPIRASDEAALETFYSELSDEARRSRFLGCTRGLDHRCAHEMCEANGRGEAGYVAENLDGIPRRIVGHVSLTRAGCDEVEVGIAVADRWQHHGIGRRLFAAAMSWAESRDVGRVVATAFTDNWKVMRLLQSPRYASATHDVGCGLSAVAIQLRDDPSEQKGDCAGRQTHSFERLRSRTPDHEPVGVGRS